MSVKIDTVDARTKLKPRKPPYWHRLSTGCHLGFRKMTSTSVGSWVAQAYDPGSQKQVRRSLGEFDNLPASQRFDAAKKAAEDWFGHLGRGGSSDVIDVKTACAMYVSHVRTDKGDRYANDIEARFTRWVLPDKISTISLPKLTRVHVDAWRQKLAKTPVIINPHSDTPISRERAPSSVNRDMTALRAALNFAHDNNHVTTDMAWRVALRPIKNADGRREAYLDRDQRIALIEKSPADLALFLRGLANLPLRPGALAALTVSKFDKRLQVLSIGTDKAGADRKIKLPVETAKFLTELSNNKTPAAPLFSRSDGSMWTKDAWKKPIKAAAEAAELPSTTTAYSMRHSSITDLVTGGLDLLTVAQLSGTSVSMIEKHYGHLRAEHAATALAKLAI